MLSQRVPTLIAYCTMTSKFMQVKPNSDDESVSETDGKCGSTAL